MLRGEFGLNLSDRFALEDPSHACNPRSVRHEFPVFELRCREGARLGGTLAVTAGGANGPQRFQCRRGAQGARGDGRPPHARGIARALANNAVVDSVIKPLLPI